MDASNLKRCNFPPEEEMPMLAKRAVFWGKLLYPWKKTSNFQFRLNFAIFSFQPLETEYVYNTYFSMLNLNYCLKSIKCIIRKFNI